MTIEEKMMEKVLLDTVRNQMKSNDPPETRQTYDRLINEGWSDEDTRTLIAECVSVEIFQVMAEKQPFNRERFVANLNNLPTLPKGLEEDKKEEE